MVVSENTKKEKFREKWMSKGIDDAVNRLWTLQSELNQLANSCKEIRKNAEINEVIACRLRVENERLKDVLQENGIRPKRLLVEYFKEDCENCDHSYYEDYNTPQCGAEENWEGEECTYKKVIETMSFYTYQIDDDELWGINSDFEEANFDVVKITDENTGRVVFKGE